MYFQKPAALSSKKKKSKLKIIQDYRLNEPFTFESSETQREELLMTGSLQKAHAQLRRLRNDSSILKDAYITAIPNHKSKVFFKYTNVPKLTSFRSSTPVGKFVLYVILVQGSNLYCFMEVYSGVLSEFRISLAY